MYTNLKNEISSWKKNKKKELRENRIAWMGLMVLVGLIIITTLIYVQ